MNRKNMSRMLALSFPVLLMTACGGNNGSAEAPAATAPEAKLAALDARQQDIYDTNCAVCHSMVGSGAPQTAVIGDWQTRSGKGMESMLNNVMDGFQAMPAMGGCFDCTEEDFRPLISYMTSGLLP